MTAKIPCVASNFLTNNNLCNNSNAIIHIVTFVLRLTCQIQILLMFAYACMTHAHPHTHFHITTYMYCACIVHVYNVV